MTLRPALFAAFAGMGVTASLFPALLPLTADRIGIPVESALAAIPVLFAGLLVGVIVSSLSARHLPTAVVLAVGSGLQFVGIAALVTAADQPGLIVAGASAGLGFGLAEASASVLAKAAVALRAGGDVAALLTALTATVAVAAAVCPLVVALLLQSSQIPFFAVTVGLLHLAAIVLLIPALRTRPADRPEKTRPAHPAQADAARLARQPSRLVTRMLPIAAALFCYVGVESIFSGWSSAVPRTLLQITPASAAIGTSAFWILMALGRLTATALHDRRAHPLDASTLLRICCTGAGLALLLAALSDASSPVVALVALGCAVLCLAPIYALVLGSALHTLDAGEGRRATGFLVAAGAAGGSGLPALLLATGLTPVAPAALLSAAVLLAAVAVLSPLSSRSSIPVPPPYLDTSG